MQPSVLCVLTDHWQLTFKSKFQSLAGLTFLLALGNVCGVVFAFLFFGVLSSVSSSSLSDDSSSFFLFPLVPT